MFKKLWTNKNFRVFTRTVFNAIIAFIGTRLAGLDGQSAVIAVGLAIPFLNAFSKFINVKFFNDLGVEE